MAVATLGQRLFWFGLGYPYYGYTLTIMDIRITSALVIHTMATTLNIMDACITTDSLITTATVPTLTAATQPTPRHRFNRTTVTQTRRRVSRLLRILRRRSQYGHSPRCQTVKSYNPRYTSWTPPVRNSGTDRPLLPCQKTGSEEAGLPSYAITECIPQSQGIFSGGGSACSSGARNAQTMLAFSLATAILACRPESALFVRDPLTSSISFNTTSKHQRSLP